MSTHHSTATKPVTRRESIFSFVAMLGRGGKAPEEKKGKLHDAVITFQFDTAEEAELLKAFFDNQPFYVDGGLRTKSGRAPSMDWIRRCTGFAVQYPRHTTTAKEETKTA